VVPFLFADLVEAVVRHLMGGIVDKDIEPAEFVHDFVNKPATVFGILYVVRHEQRATAGFLDPMRRLLRVLMLAQIGDQHVGAPRAKAIATARPMPGSAPVIKAARSLSLPQP
jgi:hypothetical protein